MSHSSRAPGRDYVTLLLISRPLTVAVHVWSSDSNIILYRFFLLRRLARKIDGFIRKDVHR